VKIKRTTGLPDLEFEPTADILHDLVAKRHEGQVIVGFAAETNDVEHNGLAKLRHKDVDLLVVNDVAAPGAGFEHATNEVTLLGRDEVAERVSMRSKEAVSLAILTRVASLLSQGAP
jgi:phosphopantothenoylcysteine decarboxylase/phosphopantothenate--cysteine ligase